MTREGESHRVNRPGSEPGIQDCQESRFSDSEQPDQQFLKIKICGFRPFNYAYLPQHYGPIVHIGRVQAALCITQIKLGTAGYGIGSKQRDGQSTYHQKTALQGLLQ